MQTVQNNNQPTVHITANSQF